MNKQITEPVRQVNWSEPITSGFESADVRWTLPYRKQQYINECKRAALCEELRLGEQKGGEDCRGRSTNSRAEVGALAKTSQRQQLVYSSISDTKQNDSSIRVDLYPVSARIVREKIHNTHTPIPPDRTGTEIQGFSLKSRARLRFTAANSRDKIRSQFCMTYGDVWPINGRSLKHDLTKFLKRIRKHTQSISYIWIAEFQTRGAPHFHFFSDLEPTPQNHDMLTHAWFEIAGYGQDKVLRVHAHETNFIAWDMGNAGYLCKYLDKEAQKTIPQGFASFGRFWGNSQDLTPKVIEEITKDEIQLFSKIDNGWQYLVRGLGKYHEHIYKRSTVRTTPQSRTILTGAAIVKQLSRYIDTAQRGNQIMDKFFCEECGQEIDQAWTVYESGLGFVLCTECKDNNAHNADYIERAET